MIWHKDARNYRVLSLPVTRPLYELNHDETKMYFRWFLSHIQERVNYLTSYIPITENKLQVCLTPDSLITLWEWFMSVAQIENPSRPLHAVFPSLRTIRASFGHTMSNQKKISTLTPLFSLGLRMADLHHPSKWFLNLFIWQVFRQPSFLRTREEKRTYTICTGNGLRDLFPK